MDIFGDLLRPIRSNLRVIDTMKDIERLEKQMYLHAQNLEFEEAIKLRNRVKRLEEQLKK